MGARVTNGITPEQQKERLEIVRREAGRAHDRNDRFFKTSEQVRDRPRNAHGPKNWKEQPPRGSQGVAVSVSVRLAAPLN